MDTADGGEFTNEVWVCSFSSGKWVKMGPRESNFHTGPTSSVNNAIVFPAKLPERRFAHAALVVGGASKKLYITGGLASDDDSVALEDAWVFDHEAQQWEEVSLGKGPAVKAAL